MYTDCLLDKLNDKKYLENIERVYMERESNLFYAICLLKDGSKEREIIYNPENNHSIDEIEEEMKNWNIDKNNPGQSLFNFSMRAMHISLDIY